MHRGRPKTPLTLTTDEVETLERWARRPTTAQALAQRARIVLACTTGQDDTVVAAAARVTRQTVGRWRRRFIAKRLAGLLDESRPGAPRWVVNLVLGHHVGAVRVDGGIAAVLANQVVWLIDVTHPEQPRVFAVAGPPLSKVDLPIDVHGGEQVAGALLFVKGSAKVPTWVLEGFGRATVLRTGAAATLAGEHRRPRGRRNKSRSK